MSIHHIFKGPFKAQQSLRIKEKIGCKLLHDRNNPQCTVPKISILPPQKGLEFTGGWGFYKAKKFKEMYEA